MIWKMSGRRKGTYPVVKDGERDVAGSKEKAELTAETLAVVHSCGNLSKEERLQREHTTQESKEALQEEESNHTLDVLFSLTK